MSPTTITSVPETTLLPTKAVVASGALSADSASTINYQNVPTEKLDEAFGDFVDLAVKTCGGHVLVTSDEWFAETHNLLTAAAPISRKGHFTANGAWFDGWETRRHGSGFDWCVIQLGLPGTIAGFEIDTAFFTGNHSPLVSVEGFTAGSATVAAGDKVTDGEKGGSEDDEQMPITAEDWAAIRWVPILPKVSLNPDSRHGFKLEQISTSFFTHVRFRMYPDGGVARLRVYGNVHKALPRDPAAVFDLAAVSSGARVEDFSDAHYGHPSNLLLPGRGHDMSDGWETKRSRAAGHIDWCHIKLGIAGHATLVEVDTAHYMGNPPKAVSVHGFTESDVLRENPIVLVSEAPVHPHRQHFFQIPESVSAGSRIDSVKVVMIPDGGIKRVRIYGSASWPASPLPKDSQIGKRWPLADEFTWNAARLQAEPITKEAFAPWGQVIEVPASDSNSVMINQGSAEKFSNVGQFVNWRSYALQDHVDGSSALPDRSNPDIAPAKANIAILQCYRPTMTAEINVKLLERHPHSSQMFVPLGGDSNGGYVVVVAKDKSDGTPDKRTLKAFTVNNSQGINYKPNVWHHPMVVTGRPVTFLTITHESGVGKDDTELHWFAKEGHSTSTEEGDVAAVVRL
ncbi:Allantoicase [Gryganskiella cystojenkinii]|nr:Allantoicase [Gryganskiella cystojenkinii]